MRNIYIVWLNRLGGENLAVAQNAYAVKEKEINMVFGLLLSVARLVSNYIMIHRLCDLM